MKSVLFRRFDLTDVNSSKFIKDINKVLSIKDKALITIINSLPQLINKTTSVSQKAEINKLAKRIKVDAETIAASSSIFEFFFRQTQNDDLSTDTPSMWADDLIESKAINEELRNKFITSIELMKSDLSESLKKEIMVKQMKAGVLPSFAGIYTTVELRTVLDKEFVWGNPIKDFSPKIIGWVPIVSILIKTDSEKDNNYYFQGDIDDLNIIIQELAAAVKTAELASKK